MLLAMEFPTFEKANESFSAVISGILFQIDFIFWMNPLVIGMWFKVRIIYSASLCFAIASHF